MCVPANFDPGADLYGHPSWKQLRSASCKPSPRFRQWGDQAFRFSEFLRSGFFIQTDITPIKWIEIHTSADQRCPHASTLIVILVIVFLIVMFAVHNAVAVSVVFFSVARRCFACCGNCGMFWPGCSHWRIRDCTDDVA